MFFSMFVISFIVSSFSAVGIMLIKAIFRKQLTVKWHYNLWFLLMVALTLPFVPSRFFYFGTAFTGFDVSGYSGTGVSVTGSWTQEPGNANWLQDFTISVNDSTPPFLQIITIIVWLAGVFAFAIVTVLSWLKIKDMKNSSRYFFNKEILDLLERCKQHLHIHKDLIVLESPLVKSPMVFGLFKTYLVFPVQFSEWLSRDEIKYIFLHELNHLKNKDNITNYWIVMFQLLYWFNPLVWIAFRKMRLDREIACDIAVLQSLGHDCHAEYGNTIINFADRVSRPMNLALASQLVSPKSQIKQRIKTIASFRAESKRLRIKSIAVFLLAGLLVSIQIPFVSAMAGEDQRYSFTGERTSYENLSAYFSGYEGSFVLYDMQADQYRIYNEQNSTWRVSPDSTYKIYSALIGLESNAIEATNSEIEWSGEKYPYDAWNKEHNLYTAMKYSVDWYFQKMESRIDRKHLQQFVKQIDYGNADISGGPAPYWLESSLKISPVEQVLLLKAFYTNHFGFQEKHIQTVKDAIKLEEKDGALLSGKTGTGAVNNKNTNGWFIGYVEENGNTFIFATNIKSEDHANGSTAAELTLKILRDKGIY
ncbi:BlaR1 family beta-lactam sensor/signal transducer [Paenibacillus spongiae]|uniref:BlaR1 family beta-lactam sensor/signal transducer n=1 Tax=Paenibacillus spongiae TaxID=2909671 RepID=A0ABY5SG57_9BACL|nr:BlaR1 family beta-lactam sensor/signal transducer [Paenibacillus spongiae]UVI32961.1 BlaR1 family beta-lactam sensor/signal transducer [Paenibacillus spongiae]